MRSVSTSITTSTVAGIASDNAAAIAAPISGGAISLLPSEEDKNGEEGHCSQDHEQFARSVGFHCDLPSAWVLQPQGNPR